jgi:hypothetical protein
MVTLLGFFCIIFNVGLLELMDPDLLSPKQAWVCYSYGLGVWAYSTMDNIDGKQARRTGTSSGLGELFDHGIDSLNCTLASLLEASAMGLGSTRLGAFTALVPCLPMFFSTWETYHTHTLYLGYFNGPTEGLLIASLIMAASGIWGAEMWKEPLAKLFGNEAMLGKISFLDLWVPIILFALSTWHRHAGLRALRWRRCSWNGLQCSSSSERCAHGLDHLTRTSFPTTTSSCCA